MKKTAQAATPLDHLGPLGELPKKDREELGRFLSALKFKDGDEIFEEGSRGDSLYIVSSGRVQIIKRAWEGEYKEVARFGPGDWFGEMALFSGQKRSAKAVASGEVSVVRLSRAALVRWMKSKPKLAVGLLFEMARGQSLRLGRTTAEFALLYQLSRLLLEGGKSARELLEKALPHLTDAWGGRWSAAAFVYNPYNEEMEPAASLGGEDFSEMARSLAEHPKAGIAWSGPSTLSVLLRSREKPLGALVLRCDAALSPAQQDPIQRTMEAAAPLLGSALENIAFRAEETMRARLKGAADSPGQ